jgi:hypothetical protein
MNPDQPVDLTPEPHSYQWITNEGLLRDEGTIYGIAGASLQEKIEAIKDYYRIKKAAIAAKHQLLEKKIAEVIDHSPKRSSENHPNTIKPHPNLFPILIQLLFYTGICFFNYWLETYWLLPVFHSPFICIGLYLFGLFSVFIGRSILYNSA